MHRMLEAQYQAVSNPALNLKNKPHQGYILHPLLAMQHPAKTGKMPVTYKTSSPLPYCLFYRPTLLQS